ncbi:heparan-alpha-glucosaminide N-acetyltransferase domain-containing protein [Agromyces albus]|uniref:heparan-alpha-glucosaminide N-acetyltransferase domain-containing protein n=1 Tax=Agromyces albus TaxID=205332 RepID=UPI002789F527|nr:heparan-alpha-glucosaminide N-acetyltransferase domain-containing protein [Agromyces albus]MDQ0574571.1 putative membrane protein [Agromyces albus]
MSADASGLVSTARMPRRIDGVDAARGLALIGMFIAHVAPDVDALTAAEFLALADERPRLLFALTAGIGLGFMSGGMRPISDGRGDLRRQIAVRAVILIALGMLIWSTLNPLVFIILDVYGVAFLVMLPLLFVSRRVTLGAGIVLLAVTPAVASIGAHSEFVNAVRRTPLKFLADWAVGGAYPVIVWVSVMLIGLALARYDLTSGRVIGVAALAGTAAASVFLPISRLLPAPEIVAEMAWSVPLRASLETLGNVGVGVLTVAAMLTLTALARPVVRRVAGTLLSPITAMGSMPLSIYTIHLVIIGLAVREEDGVITDDSWPLLIGLIVGSMLFAWLWRRYLGRGPLERILRWASGRSRATADSRATAESRASRESSDAPPASQPTRLPRLNGDP